MRFCKSANIMTFGFLTVALVATIWGGALTSVALAATPEVMIQNENDVRTVVKTEYSADEKQALDLLNADRASHGLKALNLNPQLTALGERYAQDMINRHFFAHNDPDGKSPFDRMHQAGIDYSYAGENLAINSDIINAEKAFMNSPGHRSNILSPHYTDVGLGVGYDDRGSAYVVQEFISN